MCLCLCVCVHLKAVSSPSVLRPLVEKHSSPRPGLVGIFSLFPHPLEMQLSGPVWISPLFAVFPQNNDFRVPPVPRTKVGLSEAAVRVWRFLACVQFPSRCCSGPFSLHSLHVVWPVASFRVCVEEPALCFGGSAAVFISDMLGNASRQRPPC